MICIGGYGYALQQDWNLSRFSNDGGFFLSDFLNVGIVSR